MKMTRAGQLGGTGVRLKLQLPMTLEQMQIAMERGMLKEGEPAVLDFEFSPLTARARDKAITAYPSVAAPVVGKDKDGEPIYDHDAPEFIEKRYEVMRKRSILHACFALGVAFFGTDDLDRQVEILLGPPQDGGLELDKQIIPIAVAAANAAGLAPERAKEITASVVPTVPGGQGEQAAG